MAGSAAGPRSLKAKALQWLAQREHSRVELQRKLLRSLQRDAARAAAERLACASAAAGPGPAIEAFGRAAGSALSGSAPADRDDVTLVSTSEARAAIESDPQALVEFDPAATQAQVTATLDWLQARGYLSDERFVESRLHARAARYGNLRIRGELQQHRVELTDEQALALRSSEAGRAGEVLARRFADPPRDATERARRIRFLAARGFSQDAIRSAMRANADRPADRDAAEPDPTID